MRNDRLAAAAMLMALAACGPSGAPDIAATLPAIAPSPAASAPIDPRLAEWLTRGKWSRKTDAVGGDACRGTRRQIDFQRAGASLEIIRLVDNIALAGAIVPLAAGTTNRTNLSVTRETVESLRGESARIIIASRDANYRWTTELEQTGEDAFVLKRVSWQAADAAAPREERRPEESYVRCRT
jgi:hypothetical protein